MILLMSFVSAILMIIIIVSVMELVTILSKKAQIGMWVGLVIMFIFAFYYSFYQMGMSWKAHSFLFVNNNKLQLKNAYKAQNGV